MVCIKNLDIWIRNMPMHASEKIQIRQRWLTFKVSLFFRSSSILLDLRFFICLYLMVVFDFRSTNHLAEEKNLTKTLYFECDYCLYNCHNKIHPNNRIFQETSMDKGWTGVGQSLDNFVKTFLKWRNLVKNC